jgi:Ca2+-binding RTX toxin-like protein
VTGNAAANHISAFPDTSNNLHIRVAAPETTAPPGNVPANTCHVVNDQEFYCNAGYFLAIYGSLGGAADSFVASSNLGVLIGATLNGVPTPLAGGDGPDTVIGGAEADFLNGNGAKDRVKGGPGSDLLKGKGGADALRGGTGRDKLDGGSGNDSCKGGPGMDLFRNCETGSQ